MERLRRFPHSGRIVRERPSFAPREIADDLRSALGQMEEILADLEERADRVE